jgi:hypothetical protein
VDVAGFGAATASFEALFSTVVPPIGFSTVVALLEALFAFSLPTTRSFRWLLELPSFGGLDFVEEITFGDTTRWPLLH